MTREGMKRAILAALSAAITALAACGPDVRTLERDGLSIHHLSLGLDNVWVVNVPAGGTLMIDTATKGNDDDIFAGLDAVDVSKPSIDLVVVTHAHMDHVGNAAVLQDELGAPIALHRKDVELAASGESRPVHIETLEGALIAPFLDYTFPPFEPDLVLGADTRLDAYGIPGELMHFDAHTPGSVAVVLDTGDAFIGDLVRGADEGARGEREGECTTHVFTADHDGDRAAMEALLARGVTAFFPGHGPWFDADTVRGWLEDTDETPNTRKHASADIAVD